MRKGVDSLAKNRRCEKRVVQIGKQKKHISRNLDSSRDKGSGNRRKPEDEKEEES